MNYKVMKMKGKLFNETKASSSQIPLEVWFYFKFPT